MARHFGRYSSDIGNLSIHGRPLKQGRKASRPACLSGGVSNDSEPAIIKNDRWTARELSPFLRGGRANAE